MLGANRVDAHNLKGIALEARGNSTGNQRFQLIGITAEDCAQKNERSIPYCLMVPDTPCVADRRTKFAYGTSCS